MKLTNREEKYFKDLTQLIAPSGCENEVAYYLNNEYQKLGYKIIKDNLGSIFALKNLFCKSMLTTTKRIVASAARGNLTSISRITIETMIALVISVNILNIKLFTAFVQSVVIT